MTSINPNDPYFINRQLEREKELKQKSPPQSSKDFNSLVQSKQKQSQQSEVELAKEQFAAISEESEAYSPTFSQNKYYTPVRLTREQAKLVNSMNLDSDTSNDIKDKLEEAELFNANATKRSKAKQVLKKDAKDAADELKGIDESLTIELSPEEIKNLQSFIQKDPNSQNSTSKELLKQLEEALQNMAQSNQPPLSNKKTEINQSMTSLQVNDPRIRNDNTPSKLQNKTEVPLSPMQALVESNKSTSQLKKQQPTKTIVPEIRTELPRTTDDSINSKNNQNQLTSDTSTLSSEIKNKQPASDQTISPVLLKSDPLENTMKKSSDISITQGKMSVEAAGIKSTNAQDTANPVTNPVVEESSVTSANLSQINPNETNSMQGNASSTLSSDQILSKNKVKKSASEEVDMSKTIPITENRTNEPVLNERFSSKKEKTPLMPEVQFNTAPKIDPRTESVGTAKQAEVSSVQNKIPEGTQPVEIKSSRKKDSDTRTTTEAEVNSASSVSPVLQGVESSVQMQPDRQQISRETVVQLIKELVDQILVIRTQGQTDTLVTLRSPPMLEGATIKISTYDQARGEVNITFANLSPEAKRLLDSNLAKESLSDNLKERSDIVVHNIITTTQAETSYILPEKRVRDEQEERSGRQSQEDEGNEQ